MSWAPLYSNLADLKNYLRIPDTTDDSVLTSALEDASRSVDQFTSRQFGQSTSTEARFYTPTYSRRRQAWAVETDDLMTSVGLIIAVDTANNLTFSTTVDPTTCRLAPYNAAPVDRPWTSIQLPEQFQGVLGEGSVLVTATWGWTSVPGAVADATLLQASRFVKRRESPFGIAGSPEMGTEFRLSRWLDPDVQVMLRSYMRFWLAA